MGQLGALFIEWLRSWFPPWKIINADEQGAKFSLGKPAGCLAPGLHLFVPFLQEIRIINVVYQQIDLPNQTVTTSDGFSVTLSANIGYTITDALKMELGVQHLDTTLAREAMGWLATKVSEMTYDDLLRLRKTFPADLRKTLQTRVKEWGILIEAVMLTDFAKTRQYRIFN